MTILSKQIISNSAWMIFEKIISMFGLIFVMSFVAKYIGPSNFGKITLATTIFTFVQTLTWFGNQEILFKRVSKNQKSGLIYLYGTQNIRRIIFTFLSIPILCWLYFFSDFLTLIFGVATALASYFLVQDIFVVYNNAVLNSYINAIVNIIGLVVALLTRYIIVWFELDIVYLSIPIVLVTLVPFLMKNYCFNVDQKTICEESRDKIKIKKYIKYYMGAGSSLVVSNLSIALYTQITSLFLVWKTSTYELGLYSVAVALGMSWGFVNQAIITSVLSKIYKEKNDYLAYEMVAKLNFLIIVIASFVILLLIFLGKWVVNLLYGQAYLSAYPLLIIMALAATSSGLGTISARLIIREEGYSYISKKMLFVAISSLPISYLCIHWFGLLGAAYSVFLIEFLSFSFFNYFYKKGLIFKIHLFPFYKNDLKKRSLETM